MKTKYRLVQTSPEQWWVQSRNWYSPFWWPVRPCFFIEEHAQEYFQDLVDNKYPRVIREEQL